MCSPLPRRAVIFGLLVPVLAGLAACTHFRTSSPSAWGIEVVALRRSAGGTMLDFRYRVTDAERARPILDRKAKAYLIDKASGRRLGVPDTPKVGPLRQTSRQPIVGRTYFVMFGNPGRLMKAGDRATVVIGDFRAEDLVVE